MTLTPNQRTVLKALRDFGKADDATLAIVVHNLGDSDMSSSGVRTRRNELVRKGLIEVVGVRKMRSGRNAAVHAITANGRTAIRASRVRRSVTA